MAIAINQARLFVIDVEKKDTSQLIVRRIKSLRSNYPCYFVKTQPLRFKTYTLVAFIASRKVIMLVIAQ